MKTSLHCGAAALLTLACAQPVLGQDSNSDLRDAIPEGGAPIIVAPIPQPPAAGLMNEHMHDGGEVMLGLRWVRQGFSGANRAGTGTIADSDILAAGYSVRTKTMTMDMVMLDIMYAPTDDITLMVMPHWMRHEMTMVGIDPMAGMDMDQDHGEHMAAMDHSHHALAFGESITHASSGVGDTLISASHRLAKSRKFDAHVTLGVWAPTGSVSKKNADGTFVHYGMQGGSGTWDLAPSITISGHEGAIGWGMQAGYRWRMESANKSGFAFGDEASISAWTSYAASNAVSLTGRIAWEHEGQILGHYNGSHNHSSPADLQGNYGGETVLLAAGVNLVLPVGGKHTPKLGIEMGLPVHQDLNGIQVPEDWRLSILLSKTF